MNTTRYKNDKRLRDKLFVPNAMMHPAKGHLGLWQDIIEKYTQPGDTILDPMAGVGATLMAALMGRNVVCVELEQHFVEPMKASWEKMKRNPMLGYSLGEVLILRGDARCLPLNSADHAIFSPPWQNIDAQVSADKFADPEGFAERSSEHYRDGSRSGHYASKEAILKHMNKNTNRYTRPVDAIVTSPPYQERKAYEGQELQENQRIQQGGFATLPHAVSTNTENIGNKRGEAYWESMRLVYSECHRVLRPGGIMALVLKGFTRDGQYVDLPAQTQALCESLGFTHFDTWARELWSLSFWRILQRRRSPDTFDGRLNYEYVLAFRK